MTAAKAKPSRTTDAPVAPEPPRSRIATTVPARRVLARKLLRDIPRDDHRALRAAADSFNADGEKHLAFELCRARPDSVACAPTAWLRGYSRGLSDWASVDCFACFMSGVAWREGALKDDQIIQWARSNDRWLRRCALVSTVPLNNKARGATAPKGDANRTLMICALLVNDRDDMVVKAMSWALRELATRDPKAVKAFIAQHKSHLAPRVLREVGNKLTTGLKNPKNNDRAAARTSD